MIHLVPDWAHEYDEFWRTIRRRNSWFIKIRYFVGISLFICLLLGQYVFNLRLSLTQEIAISAICLSILTYNFILQIVRPKIGCNPNKFNCMHLSLIQMLFDFGALILLVYYTGIIDSPFYVFFIFNTIVGSLILPGYLIYLIVISVVVVYGSLIFLQHFNLIQSHLISGLYEIAPNNTFIYIVIFVSVFAIMMMMSIFIANRIAETLLMRESQLRDTLNQLSEAEITKQKYIMGVVHEIKTPIAAVQSIIDLVLQKYLGPISEEIEKKLNRAHTRSDEAIKLINNILHLSKFKLLNITSIENFDIVLLIKQQVDKKIEKAEAKNIEISLEDRRKTKKQLSADKMLIELAVSNIIGNAIKYNLEDGKVEIIVNEIKAMLNIEFNDTGVGIPQKEMNKVFDQFYRASNIKNKNSHEGSGMGLYLANEITLRHNGTIQVNSPSRLGTKDRPGTSIGMSLPYTQEMETEEIKTLSLTGRI